MEIHTPKIELQKTFKNNTSLSHIIAHYSLIPKGYKSAITIVILYIDIVFFH